MLKFSLYTTVFCVLLFACSEKEDRLNKVDFDVTAMLDNYANNLIEPAYGELATKATSMQQAVGDFTANPTEGTLATAQLASLDAWQAYQNTVAFNGMGPADNQNFRVSIASFPASVAKIETKIEVGSWDFNESFAEENKGFATLDYLLFGYDADGKGTASKPETATTTQILGWYTTNGQASTRKEFINAVAKDIAAASEAVHNAWRTEGGNYVTSFGQNTSSGAGSSLSILVNSYVVAYEYTKREKLYKPLGGSSTTAAARSVEAYFSEESLSLLKSTTQHLEEAFVGGSGLGLDDYLQAHFNAGNTQGNYADEMAMVFDDIQSALANISQPLKAAVSAEKEKVSAAYAGYQNGIPLLKADIMGVLGVTQSYTDNDGD